MLNNSVFRLLSLTLFSVMLLTACNKDESDTANLEMAITDGPVDDANVKGVFVTIVDVMIDGKSWSGFKGATTLDLMAYQNGTTTLLGTGDVAAKSYSEIVLVLNTAEDVSGNAPGCYVLDNTNKKHQLVGSTQKQIKVKGNFTAEKGQTTKLVTDFDLRKSIVFKAGAQSNYTFVSDAELEAALRLMNTASTGTLKGTCTDNITSSEKIVVYAYKKGTFNLQTEKNPQGASQIAFAGAVNSAGVDGSNHFNLSFLEAGDYELHFIGYKDTNADGRLEATGELQLNLVGSLLDVLNLDLAASASVDLNILITGIIPL